MSLLLDTHVLLWWLGGDPRLGPRTAELIADPRREVRVSAAAVWEIAIKRSVGKVETDVDVIEQLRDQSSDELPVRAAPAVEAGDLPDHHRDPFDRMLVAPARLEQLTVGGGPRVEVTSDDAGPASRVTSTEIRASRSHLVLVGQHQM